VAKSLRRTITRCNASVTKVQLNISNRWSPIPSLATSNAAALARCLTHVRHILLVPHETESFPPSSAFILYSICIFRVVAIHTHAIKDYCNLPHNMYVQGTFNKQGSLAYNFCLNQAIYFSARGSSWCGRSATNGSGVRGSDATALQSYSHDFAPSDFHVVGSPKQHFRGSRQLSNQKWKLLVVNGYECKSPISTATEFLISCQDETNASMSSGTVLKNSGTLAE
jgi:hypothetical protein